MSRLVALFGLLAIALSVAGCDNGKADVSKAQQAAYDDRNPAHYKGVPPGFGHGGSPPAGAAGAGGAAAGTAGK
jgi:hypothetical protein